MTTRIAVVGGGHDTSAPDGVDIREVDAIEELDAVESLLSTIWSTGPERPPVNREVLRAFAHAGCYVAAAYADDAMVAASAGFLGGGGPGEVHLHSHITGVLPAAQGRHIGLALKLHQRAWCLERGIEVVTWTFDPLVRRNAWFNLHRLGADVVELVSDFYGAMTDGINAGLASDRFVARWSLPEAAARPAIAPADGDVVVPVEPSSRQALRDAYASGLHVVGMTEAGAEYVLRA